MSTEDRKYTPVEEFMNAFSHSIGALFSIYAIVMLAVSSKTPMQASSTAIFGATLFILFQSSALFIQWLMKRQKSISKN